MCGHERAWSPPCLLFYLSPDLLLLKRAKDLSDRGVGAGCDQSRKNIKACSCNTCTPRMKNPLALACIISAFGFCSSAQTSDSLSGPRVWLNADRSQLTANAWTDLSLFKRDATSPTAATLPSPSGSINFNPALSFDGIDDYLQIPYSLDGLSELSVLAVFQSTDTTERGIWGSEESMRKVLLTTRRAIGPDSIADEYGRNEHTTVLNTVVQTWDDAGVTVATTGSIALGSAGKARSYKPFKGALAELLIFNRALSFLERVQYETYLALKYGTGLRGGNFVSSGEKVLWHVAQNTAYGYNIAGIGRDDFFKLSQKQSGSAYDSGLLVINAGKLAESNQQNAGTINNQDFIVWGDNGLPIDTKPGEGADSLLSVVQRKWLVTATGNSANKLATELHIDANRLPAESMSYWLVIDRSGQGNFSADNLEYILPDRISEGKIIYKDVLWDTDGSGKDHFGFARAKNLFAVVRTLKNPSCTDETAGKIRIEVIAGEPAYNFTLKDKDATIEREWRQKTDSIQQKDLVGGEYTLTLRDGSRETLTRYFTLTVPDALDITLGPDRALSQTEPIVLDVSEQVPDSVKVSYRWENSFGFSSSERSIKATEPGVYRVFVTKESDGCVFTDDVAITGADKQTIAVYPTILQSNDNYNVSVSMAAPGSVIVKVYNAKGILMEEMSGTGNSEYQFITRLRDSGIFLVVVQTPSGMETHKIVVH